MTGWILRATWPLAQGADRSTAGFARHKVLASQEIDGIAEEAGCRIVGPVAWSMTASHLIAVASAVPLTGAVAA